MERNVNNKRTEERVYTALPVDLETSTGITRDVSASGMFFETDAAYAVGAAISCKVDVDTPGGRMVLKCRGEIVRIERRGARVGVAVKIVESIIEPGK